MSDGAALADLLDDRQRRPVERAGEVHLRVQVEARLAVDPHRLRVRRRREHRRGCRRGRGSSPRPAAACRCPDPADPGSTAYVARHHSVSRRYDVAIPTMPVSSSATQQPPGSVRRKCRVRSIQTARCGSERRSGAGPSARRIRVSSSKKPSSLTRSAAGDVVGQHRPDPQVSHGDDPRSAARMGACEFWWPPTSSPARSPRSRRPRRSPTGWRRRAPDDELDLAPMADGGPGLRRRAARGARRRAARGDGPRPARRADAGDAAGAQHTAGHGVRRDRAGVRAAPDRRRDGRRDGHDVRRRRAASPPRSTPVRPGSCSGSAAAAPTTGEPGCSRRSARPPTARWTPASPAWRGSPPSSCRPSTSSWSPPATSTTR